MHTQITTHSKEKVDAMPPPEQGVYAWGLFLDGAAWDPEASLLCDQPPKQLFCAIPIMFITALEAREKQRALAAQATYKCPVYTIPQRTGVNFVFTADVASQDPEYKWILRGVALVCTKE